jgi:hypothetical protein
VQLTDWLTGAGHTNIVLVDNASSYPPLLEWYGRCGHSVVRLEENAGHRAPFELGLVPTNLPYVVTDCDVVPDDDCPLDAVDHLLDLLLSYDVNKVGLGLVIDQLPATNMARVAQDLEQRFWVAPLGPGILDAPVDTTFAIYRPGLPFDVEGARTAAPYVARHLTWYLEPDDIPEDEQWYLDRKEGFTGYSGQY